MCNTLNTISLTNNLLVKLIANDYHINDEIKDRLVYYITHLNNMHYITLSNIDRLIDGFMDIKLKHTTTDSCNYYDKEQTHNSCILSYNWGKQKKWNTNNDNINMTVFKYFSSSIIHFISGFNDFITPTPIINDDDFKQIYIDDLEINAVALQRISTEHQLKSMKKEKDDFIGLIKSINKKSDDVENYLIKGFNQDCNYVYLKPLEGKANWTTLLFRVPRITNLFVKLYKSTGKKLIAKINGKDQVLSLTGLTKAIAKGLETTEQEKIISYIPNAYNPNMKGHLTQLLIFAFGLFQMEANELVNMIADSSKGKISEVYLNKCVISSKNGITDYKGAFLLEEQAINVYCNKIDEFNDLIKKTNKFEEFDTNIKSTVCGLKIRKSWLFCPKCATNISEHK